MVPKGTTMIIWKGWGILTVLIFILCVAAGWLAGAYIGFFSGAEPDMTSFYRLYGLSAGLAIAAPLNWFLGRSLNRARREAGSGALNRHSLFFIPMEHWSFVFLGASVYLIAGRLGLVDLPSPVWSLL